MKTNYDENAVEHGNLVMFPASKNFPVIDEVDPLEELLNEFSHLSDEDFIDEELVFPSEEDGELELTSNILSNKNVSKMGDNELFDLINDQIKLLEESHTRIRYFLDEIDTFLPSKK
jgi:hypothetical protein